MFNDLMESQPARARSAVQTAASVVVHVLLIGAAVKLTAGAAETVKASIQEQAMLFIRPPDAPPPPPSETRVVATMPPLKGFQTAVAPMAIPTAIPPVNLGQSFDPKAFTGIGKEGGDPNGVDSGSVNVSPGVTYDLAQVDEEAQYVSGPDPKYPPALRAAGIIGRVTLRFVVDIDGKVRGGSVQVINSTNVAFEDPAREAITLGLFKPAKLHGKPVAQLVEQAVVFQIR